jgi:hypothetical protein
MRPNLCSVRMGDFLLMTTINPRVFKAYDVKGVYLSSFQR